MSNDAWNKITQTHDLFKKIITPLKEHLGINFGYMIVFNNGSYYQIIENLECLKKWVTNVETSHIFCARNVTNYFDGDYNFTLWPNEPTSLAMQIYYEHNMWNGVTISKTNKDYVELYWFTKRNAEDGWHKFFIRNKDLLLKIIKHVDSYKDALHIPQDSINKDIFKFDHGFDFNILESEYIQSDAVIITKAIRSLHSEQASVESALKKTNLSPREEEIFAIVGRGHSTKVASQKLGISINTVHYHLGHIKNKTGLNTKAKLIEFYESTHRLVF